MSRPAPRSFARITRRLPHAEPGQRIGLLGGSFNPAHAGHALISATALRRLHLDAVWWLVSPGNPLKAGQVQATLADRMASARRVAHDPRIKLTDFEAELPTAYTVSTLQYLVARYPGVRFVWLMGADNLASLHRWRAWRRIPALMPIAVIDRPGWRFKALTSPAARAFARARMREAAAVTLPDRLPPAWTLLGGPLSALSSTAIRSGRADLE